MKEFYELFRILKSKHDKYRLTIHWTSITNWTMQLDFGVIENNENIFYIEAVEENLLYAIGYCKLAEYLSEKYDGY